MTVPGGIESAQMAAERELLRLQQIDDDDDDDDFDYVPGSNISSDKVSSVDHVTEQEGTGQRY